MRGKRTPAEVTADAETAEAEQFIKRVRRVSRRHFSAEEKVRVVLEGFRREVRVSDLCRREGISPNVYYAWLKDFMDDEVAISHDLYEVMQAFSSSRPTSA